MSDSWQSFYSSEAAGYDNRRYHSWYGRLYSNLHNHAVDQALQSEPSTRMILEIASGTGHNLPVLSANGYLVTASDLTPEMLQFARQNLLSKNNIVYVINDALNLPYADDRFDVVISSRFLHLFSATQQQSIIAEMVRVLKPGKYLIIDFYNWMHWWIMSPFIFPYRLITKKRPTQDTYNQFREVEVMLNGLGLQIKKTKGIGSYLLIFCRFLPMKTAIALGRLFQYRMLYPLSEQFLICAQKRK